MTKTRLKNILCVVGTRPEAVKMAPVILGLRKEPWVDVRVLVTAQHRRMLDQVLSFFDIKPDIDLDIMRPNQTLPDLTARLLLELDRILADEKPDVVLIQGDTTTVMTVSMACFYRRIPVGHIEAGLRTGNIYSPFPEEANRAITGRLAHWHFAPTDGARVNLLREGIPAERITVTGNTVIDALFMTAARDTPTGLPLDPAKRIVLITLHRREIFGAPFTEVCRAIADLAARYQDVQFVYPVHPNPNVKNVAYELLDGKTNILLCAPLDYAPFVTLMKQSRLVLSDSGGIQEEAPALGKPLLVVRDETERPEVVSLGVVKLVGPHYHSIVRETQRLLDDTDAYHQMVCGFSPYGDGHAADYIIRTLYADLHASGGSKHEFKTENTKSPANTFGSDLSQTAWD